VVPVRAETVTRPNANQDAQGRFVKGNKLGRGNPFARRLAAMRQAFAEAVSAEDLQALAKSLYERAIAGDNAAAVLVLAYVVGKPQRVVDPDTLDQQELAQQLGGATQADVLGAMLDRADVSQALELIAGVLGRQNLQKEVFDSGSNRHLLRQIAEKRKK
jgi:hypothetical protein